MPNNNTKIKATINIGADISNFQSAVNKIQGQLNKLSLSDSMQSDFSKVFTNISNELNNIKKLTANNELSLVDEKAVAASLKRVDNLYADLVSKIESKKVKSSLFKDDKKVLDDLDGLIKRYNSKINESGSKIAAQNQKWKEQEQTIKNLQKTFTTLQAKQLSTKEAANSIAKDYEVQSQKLKSIVDEKQKELDLSNQNYDAVKKQLEQQREIFKAQYKTEHGKGGDWKTAWEQSEQYLKIVKDITEAEQKQKIAKEELNKAQKESSDYTKNYENLTKAANEATEAVKNQEAAIQKARRSLGTIQGQITRLSNLEFKQLKESIDQVTWDKLAEFGIKPENINSIQDLTNAYEEVESKSASAAAEVAESLKPALDDIGTAGKNMSDGLDQAGVSLNNISENAKQLDQMRSRILQFFSIGNAVRLFKRAIRSAMETVKDLDKVMTETAVVTEFSVGDMWSQLPEYTKRANELGVSIHSVYEASTLYYQQGLKTNEVMAVTNATLRMARIAGLEAADATDRVTNALRGFNMEINEASADNIADVYSKLAAISASNVDEISTAMTKVASLANSANMSFENTAAFLAQIIETTRESAETAGTALKTVVARFSEVKELYSKGQLLGTDEEGEEIDVNKVSKALRTAGINLNEFLTGQKGLDEIFMELAKKWDNLDIVQQRYIATMAAGSRQQSRFIALMSDYRRTQDLTTAAQNASGASLEQYNKTLESLETKLSRLKNAWDEFLMSIANSNFIKAAVDMITAIVNGLNKITDTISGGNGLLKSISAIALSVGGLKLGRGLFNSIFGDPKAATTGWFSQITRVIKGERSLIVKSGSEIGASLINGVKDKFSDLKNILARTFKSKLSASELGLQSIDLSDINFKLNKNISTEILNEARSNFDWTTVTGKQRFDLDNLNSQFANDKDINNYIKGLDKIGIKLNLTKDQADKLGVSFENQAQVMNISRVALTGTGIALTVIGGIIEKVTGKSSGLTKVFKNVGMTLTALGSLLPVISKAFEAFGISISKTIMSIPIIGWIAAIITVIITLITVIAEVVETQEEAAQRTKATFDAATEAANQAKTAVDNLKTGYEELVESASELDKLAKGTREWTEAVRANNFEVLELLNTYKELEVVNDNGVLKISNYDDVMADYQNRQLSTQIGAVGANLNVVREQAKYNTPKGFMDVEIKTTNNDLIGLTDAQTEDIALAVSEGLIRSNEDLINYLKDNIDNVDEVFGAGILDFDALKQEGDKINQANAELNNFGIALSSLAVSMAHLDESTEQYAQNFLDNGKRLSDLYDQERQNLDKHRRIGVQDNSDETVQQDYQKFLLQTYGATVASSYNRRSGDFTLNGKTIDYNSDEIKNAFASWRAANKAAQQLETYTKTIAEQGGSIAKAFEGVNGENLKQLDIQSIYEQLNVSEEDLIDAKITDLKDENSKLSTVLNDYWNTFTSEQQAALGNYGDWAKEFANSLITAQNTFKKAYSDFNNDYFKEITKDFSSSTIGAITSALQEYTPSDNGAFGAAIIDALKKLLPDDSKLESALSTFSTIQWNSIEDLESFKETLASMGIDIYESEFQDFLDTIYDGVDALTHIDFNTFNDHIKELAKLINDIRSGNKGRLFSEDEYNLLTGNGVNKDLFVQGLTGEYSYLGNNLEDIITAANKGMVEKARNELMYNQTRFDVASQISNADYWGREGVTKRAQLLMATSQARQNGTLSQWGIAGLDSNTKFGQLTDEEVNDLWEAIDVFKNSTALYAENVDKYSQSVPILEAMTLGAQGIVDAWQSGKLEAGASMYALRGLMISSDLPEQLKQQYIEIFNDPTLTESVASSMAASMANMMDVYSDAKYWGVDSEILSNMGESYSSTMGLAADTAAKLALENINLNTGLQEIVSSYDNWNQVLQQGIDDETIRQTSEYQEILAKLEKNIKQMFSLKGNLSADFMNSNETIQLLQAISTGDTKAIDTLGRNAAQDIKKQFKFGTGGAAQRNANRRGANQASGGVVPLELEAEVTEQSFAFAENQLFNFIDSLDPNIDIHTQVNPEDLNNATAGIIDQMNTMLAAGEITADQMQDYFSSIGFVPDVTYDYKQISQRFTGSLPYVDQDGNGKPKISHLEYDYTADVMTAVPQVTDIHYQGPRGNIANPSVRNAMANNAQPKSSSSSGSESKPKAWLNPYDELYNLQQKINTALREREKLEHRYQDMLKDSTKTSNDLVENTLRETAALKRQLALEQQMLAGRQRQVQNVANDKYEDSEGNITTLGAMGVMRYASYNLANNEIQIDYDAIDKITDENLGKAIEQYVSRLEELQGQITDTEDTIEEISDQLTEIQDRGKEEYLGFEQKIYDALVARREAEIAALESISDVISDAADKTVSAIQDEISKERQARENDKTESDLTDKEMRLAYLQRDTSGANDLEIIKLQKEIADDQQAYQDTIIDQAIQEMQDENARAEQQRQAQIDLLKDLLEQDKRYGVFWSDVESKLKGAFDENGKIKVESDIYKLLQEDANFQALSKFQSFQWTEDISREIAIAIQGLQNYTLSEAKSGSGKLILANGSALTYDAKSGVWYDSASNKYNDSDLYWDYNNQAYTLKATNAAQAARPASTTTTSAQSSAQPQQTPQNSEAPKLGRITNTYGWVNVRSSVAYGDNVIGHTEKGQSFDVIGYGDYGWYKIKLPNGSIGYTAVHLNGTPLYNFTPYKTGGLADFTGTAWLDGSKSRPEMVLNAADTKNFIALKDILSSILHSTQSSSKATSIGDNYFDIDIQAEIDSDYDVDQLAERIKKQIYDAAEYRNVNAISMMR